MNEANDGHYLDPVMTRLEEVLDELRLANGHARSANQLVLPSGPPREIVPNPADPDFQDRIAAKTLMSYQQVLDIYGTPKRVLPNEDGSIVWKYQTPDGSVVLLHFADGLLWGISQ